MTDEIESHVNARYVCAPEAMWRIFAFNLQQKSHHVDALAVHLEDEQTVVFPPGQERQAAERAHDTTLMGFFKLNETSRRYFDLGEGQPLTLDSRNFYYSEFPTHFVWDSKHFWKDRQRGGDKKIGRMYTVSPRDVERYALRILLLNRKGNIFTAA